MIVSSVIVVVSYLLHYLPIQQDFVPEKFTGGVVDLVNQMSWGLVIGIIFVGLLSRVPRNFVTAILGKGGGLNGILRATAAGLLLDLCSHGILLVGMQLYKRGASLGQIMAFLIASPWNSLSLTIILIALIGPFWTITFIILSAIIAIASGLIFERLVKKGILPANPAEKDLPADFHFFIEAKKGLAATKFNLPFFKDMAVNGLKESRMIIRWILAGAILAAFLRTALNPEMFQDYFGPSALGLVVTLVFATILEVCSEGGSPIAADILTRAHAPGNAFTFLMTGVATDYTEIMGLKETTYSWKIALFLPLVTTPQILIIGYFLNHFGG